MPDYICKQKLLREINSAENRKADNLMADWYYQMVNNQPAADVKLIIHAHWINECDEHFCSNCDACLEDVLQLKFTSHAEENYSLSAEEYGDEPFYIVEFDEEKLPKFCPDCGSIMDGKGNENYEKNYMRIGYGSHNCGSRMRNSRGK